MKGAGSFSLANAVTGTSVSSATLNVEGQLAIAHPSIEEGGGDLIAWHTHISSDDEDILCEW